jgi:hypothetical protein
MRPTAGKPLAEPRAAEQASHRASALRRTQGSGRVALLLVVLYGVALFATNPRVTVFDDEASIVFSSGRDPLDVLGSFLHGRGQHLHPPLYDILLHGWIRLSGGLTELLRAPSIVFSCLAIWLLGATAELLWQRRLLAVTLAFLWPPGYFYARPAHWAPLAMLLVAGTTWSYLAARQSRRGRDVAIFALFGLALVYTNYLGWAFLGALAIHLLLTRPDPPVLKRFLLAGLAIAAGFLPLTLALLRLLGPATQLESPVLLRAANALYLGYALLVSEAVAPWRWPALIAFVGIALLAYVALRTPRALPWLGLLGVVYLPATWLGLLDGKKASLMGPWLLLYLTGLLSATRRPRIAALALLLVFGTGWAGIASQRWMASHRYTEPWALVAETVARAARPGDLILCSHPSFYFYLRDELGWDGWHEFHPSEVTERSQLHFSSVDYWKRAVPGHARIIYVRSVVNAPSLERERELREHLASRYRLVDARRYLDDEGASLKNRFVGNQPPWRIELLQYERPADPG